MNPLWRRKLEPLARPLFRAYSRRARGMTLGVRGLVTDEAGRVLLIEHTYVSGWYMPGGGVERGETAEEALRREMVEEAGIELTEPPTLISIDTDHRRYPGDHVLFYRVNGWRAVPATSRGEIHDLGWFAPDSLPAGITPMTLRRVKVALGRATALNLQAGSGIGSRT